jgi:hypothetical protein
MKFFTVDLPTWFAISLEALIPLWASMKDGFTMLVNGIIGVLNTLGSGIVAGLNIAGQAIVDAINSLIKKYKKLRDSLGKFGSLLPPLDLLTFTPLTFTAIPLIAAAKGFEGMVSNPTMFLAGEAGPEMVSITPRGSSGGKTIQVFVNIHGSVWSEKEVSNVVLGKLKDQLKSLNF